MKKKTILITLSLFSSAFAVDDESIYGVYSLPNYEVEGSAADRAFKGWDFNSVTIAEDAEIGLEAVSVAHALVSLPGVDAGRRGANTIEPSIRGLGGERVATYFNGLLLPGGSPTHVAPVGFFFPGSVATVSVARAFPSVTGGPVTASGRIDLETPGLATRENSGLLATTVRSGWEGVNAIASGTYRAGGIQAYGGLSGARFGDYRTGGGDWVDADLKTVGAAGSVVWTGSGGGSANLAMVVSHQLLARNASLPLDLKDTTMVALTLDTSWTTGLSVWKFRIGYTDNQPFLTSEDRPIVPGAPIRLVDANADARNLGGGVSVTSPLGASGTTEIGLDFRNQARDAVRARYFTSGNILHDHIWPEIESTDLGVFGEIRWDETDRYRIVGGVRVDRVWNDAKAADDPVVGLPGARGDTIRKNYGAFNGPDALITKRDDWAGAAHLLVEVPIKSDDLIGYAGVGMVRAAPGETERYRAFLNALGGGMEVGNPSLGTETRWELDAGVRMRGEGWRFDVSGFLARIDDFIQREAIASGPLVYGFRNRDVNLAGFEMISEVAPTFLARLGLSLDGSFSIVRGENRATSIGIPEIPPWNLGAGLTWESSEEEPRFRLRLETRIVGSQSNPDPATMPLYRDTDGFGLWRLGGRMDAGRGWAFDLSIENLFDKRYYEYLQAPVDPGLLGPSSGTLKRGDSIPGFGRQVIISVRKRF
ncbi:MAG: hypothetical protein DRP71_08330 [Verrucomicrobia bacterium]|nr:MAG: hypothetical protein DRP71_08330 [Verrucomicrobiota bacterium]